MKVFARIILLSMLGALLIAVLTRPKPLDEQLLHLQVVELMPQYARDVEAQPAQVQALLLAYADDPVLLGKARIALTRYPEIARPVFEAFGMNPSFRDVLRRYGEDVVLPIQYFLTQEVFTLELMRSMSDTARSVMGTLRGWWSDELQQKEETRGSLSAEERGWYAIQFIETEGYGFIGQFVLTPDGRVGWLQTERVLEALNRFFAGGLTGLESKWRRDQSVNLGDIGWAAVDVAVGVGAFKLLRMGRGASAGRSLSVSQRSAIVGAGLWRGSVVGARIAKYGAPALLAYMAVRHPSVINSLLAATAEKLGLPVALVQWIGWSLLLLPLVFVLRFLLGPLAWAAVNMGRLLHWGHRSLVKA